MTTFCLSKKDRAELTDFLIRQNKRNGGWVDAPPSMEEDFVYDKRLPYYSCVRTGGGDADCESGTGYPVFRVRPDQESIQKATGDQSCPDSDFYSPFHLQGVDP